MKFMIVIILYTILQNLTTYLFQELQFQNCLTSFHDHIWTHTILTAFPFCFYNGHNT